MTGDDNIIDAEFEVVEPARGAPLYFPEAEVARAAGKWSFWSDDFPTLIGLAAGFAVLYGVRVYFRHH